jgi:anti-anti-sigma factor
MSPEPLPESPPHVLSVSIGRDAVQVSAAGDIDVAAVADLSRLMDSLDLLAYLPVDVDLSNVTFLDSSGVSPLVEAAARRRDGQLSAVRIGQCSPAARYCLDVLGLNGRPHLDCAAWDRLAARGAAASAAISRASAAANALADGVR